MSRFTERLIVSPLEDGKTWVVLNPDFGYEIGHLGSGEYIRVPQGFRTDFASVPAVLQSLLPKWDLYGNASVLHDWLYWDQGKSAADNIGSYDLGKRRDCDRVMVEAMRVLGVHPIRRDLIALTLLLFGPIGWWRNERRAARSKLKVQAVDDLLATLQQPSNGSGAPSNYA